MDASHLGPLERAALDALIATEALGVPAIEPARLLASMAYGSHLPNLLAALRGGPLAHYVATDGRRFCLVDSPEGLQLAEESAARMDRLWAELKDTIRGLCKLPWVEAVAIVGTGAFGQVPAREPLQLRVVAEGGRVRAAAAALELSFRSRDGLSQRLALESIVDADHLERPVNSPLAALRAVSLSPVMNRAAWAIWLETNPRLSEALPNLDWGREHDLGARFDGRLAVWRRRVVQGEDSPILRSSGRQGDKRLLLDRLLESTLDRSAGAEIPLAPGLPIGAFTSRREAVLAWSFDEPEAELPEEPSVEPEPAPVEQSAEAPAREAVPSTRKRGRTVRPQRDRKGAAAPDTGTRHRKRSQGTEGVRPTERSAPGRDDPVGAQ